jgi:hypothetical protein
VNAHVVGVPSAAVPGDVDNDVYVVRLADLEHLRGWHVPALVVVDATRDPVPAPSVLAQMVVVRRRLCAAGGSLVVAASPDVAGRLRGSGLHRAVPCCADLVGALAAVRIRPASLVGTRN